MPRIIVVSWLLLWGGSSTAGPTDNLIATVGVSERAGKCAVLIEGSRVPTFTLLRIGNPSRLVIDVMSADLSRVNSPIEVDNGVVTQIVTGQYRDGMRAFGRITIGVARDVPYDVKANGHSIEAIFHATPVNLKEDLAALKQTAEVSKKEATEMRERLALETKRREAIEAEAKAELRRAEESERVALLRLAAKKDAEAERLARESRERTRAAETALQRAAGETLAVAGELARERARAEAAEAAAAASRQDAVVAREELEREKRRREGIEAAAKADLELARQKEREALVGLAAKKDAETEKRFLESRERTRSAEAAVGKATSELNATLAELAVEREKARELATGYDRAKRELAEERARREATERVAKVELERAREGERAAFKVLQSKKDAETEGVMAAARMRTRAAEAAHVKASKERDEVSVELASARARASDQAREVEKTRRELESAREAADSLRKTRERETTGWVAKEREMERRLREAEERASELSAARSREANMRRAAETVAKVSAIRTADWQRKETAYREAMLALSDKDRALQTTRAELHRLMQTVEERRKSETEGQARSRSEQEKLREMEKRLGSSSAQIVAMREEMGRADAQRQETEASRRVAEAAVIAKSQALEAMRRELVLKEVAVDETRAERDRIETKELADLRGTLAQTSKEKELVIKQLEEVVAARKRIEGDAGQAAGELRLVRSALAKREIELAQHRQRAAESARMVEAERQRVTDAGRMVVAERRRVADAGRMVETERQRAADAGRLVESERRAREALEREFRTMQKELSRLRLEKATPVLGEARPARRMRDNADSETPATVTRVASSDVGAGLVVSPLEGGGRGRERLTGEVTDVRVEEDGTAARAVVATSGRVLHRFRRLINDRWALDLSHASLPKSLERTLDASDLPGGLASVSAYSPRAGLVRIVLRLREGATPSLRVEPDRFFVSASPPASRPGRSTVIAIRGQELMPVREVKRILLSESYIGATSGFGTERALLSAMVAQTRDRATLGTRVNIGRAEGQRVTLALEDADIHKVLRLIAEAVKLNFVVSDDVRGTVSILLKDVPWRTALDLVLRSKGFGYAQKGNILRVVPLKTLEEERRALEDAAAKAKADRPPQVEIIPVSYATPSELQTQVKDVLSKTGTIQIDVRTNSLIVKDYPENLSRARRVVEVLDSQTPQILIEARIVEASTNFTRDFGIQWGGDISFSPASGNPTGLAFPASVGIAGGSGQSPADGLTTVTPNYIVNLPVGSTGAIGFTMGNLAGTANLSLRLTAAEESGNARIISSPKITTLDNMAATISQGVSIPYFSVGAAGANVALTNASLSLNVTPHVTADGGIRLTVSVTKNEPDFNTRGGGGNPAMNTRSANTTVWVRDGDTTVIGGIFTRNTGLSYKEVPLFSKIPIIGWLFKNRTEKDIRQELLVFITPRILNRPAATPGGGTGAGR